MTLPFVSVIVPVYNGSRTLRSCVEALVAQTYPAERREIIVVDNNSRDGTAEIASGYAPGVQLVRQTAVQSSYASRNLGIAQAAGEIVAFVDADCRAAPGWLSALVAAFDDPQVMAVGGAVLDAAATNRVEAFIAAASPLSHYHEAPDQFLRVLITANAAFRKRALDALGAFNANLYTGADVDLAWRLQLAYGDCARYVPEAVVYHHHRSTWRGMFRQYRRHGFGEIFLDAMYREFPGYPRTLRYQLGRMARQAWALMIYTRAFVYRLLRYPFRPDPAALLQPPLWFVAESGNLLGKCQGLWATRGLRRNPARQLWQDPGER